METPILFRAGVLAALACAAAAPGQAGSEPAPPGAASLVRSVIAPVPRTPKPARFDSLDQRLDYLHENLYNTYNTRVERTDAYFGRALVEPEHPALSRFRLRLFGEITEEDSAQVSFKPSVEARIKLPNMEKLWHVFVSSRAPGNLPGVDPTEEDSALRLGLARVVHHLPVSAGAGVRLDWPPSAFAELEWGPRWTLAGWTLFPSQSLYYETDDRLGEQTRLAACRWFGSGRHWMAGGALAGNWSQSSDGLEWETTLKTAWVQELLEEQRRGRDVDRGDVARGLGARGTLFGSDRQSTEYQAMLTWRCPVYRDWMYLEVTPGFKWRRAREWRSDPFVRAGVECLFWGTPAR